MTERQSYDTKCPRCIAAHNAGEATALKLMAAGDFPPKYIAMAIVQDALTAYCASAVGESAQKEGKDAAS